ncbi:MAG: DUF2975 domain-containing protein [Caulobacterales bacterium]|nr:DUF2975 domain-containing protein [Caulobacterales bacterium]
MSQTDLARFRRRCAQFRWLAVFMVVSVGALLALIHLVAPIMIWTRGSPDFGSRLVVSVIWAIPAACYLFGVWSIGRAMGDLARGRLFQPTVSDALRRVGLALGAGGVFSVFVMSNLLRVLGAAQGGYLHFDVPGMTLGMIGGALFLLGGVVEQAGKVQAELDEMI